MQPYSVRWFTCRQTARLTLEPNAVLTALEDSPTSLNSLEKDCERARRGRSSAITTQLRTHDRLTPRAWNTNTNTHTQQYDLRHPILCEEGFLVCSPYFQQLCLSAQAFGAELHHRVRTKGVSDAILAERAKPQRQAALQLKGRNEDGLMTWVNTERKHPKEPWCEFTCMTNRSTKVCERVPLPCKAPQDKAQTAVWIQTDGYLARGVEFTLELDGATQRTDCCMRDLIQTHRRIINQLSRKQL